MIPGADKPSFRPPRFGTDGLRGRAGEPPMDQETLARLGAALGLWLQREGPADKRVLVGHDGRESADRILSALAHGLRGAEVAVTTLGLCTTPALAFLTYSQPFAAGIMISASHNPASDNGVKVFAADGTKLPDEAEAELAALTPTISPGPVRNPSVGARRELIGQYEEHLGNVFSRLDLSPFTLAVDAANGGGSELAPRLLRRFGARVETVACAPDGANINANCGALHPEHLASRVREIGADLGICLDGDGDRAIFVDETGQVRDGDQVLAVLARHLLRRGRLPQATVVATVMSNLGLHKAIDAAGGRLLVTPVGDRHVVREMRRGGFALGGEQSGHIIFDGDGRHCGDGLFTALKLLSLPGVAERGFAETFAGFQHHPQVLRNVEVRHKPDLDAVPELQRAVAEVEEELGDDGRVVLRYSGTESLCRVMVEGPSLDVVERYVDRLVEAVREALDR